TLKIGVIALLMMIGNFTWAQQQSPKTADERATTRSKKLAQQLGLTADQEKSVYTLALQQAQQQDADRTKYQGDREGMRNARKANMETFDTGLNKILTADQKTKYEQYKADEKAKLQQGGGQREGQGGGE